MSAKHELPPGWSVLMVAGLWELYAADGSLIGRYPAQFDAVSVARKIVGPALLDAPRRIAELERERDEARARLDSCCTYCLDRCECEEAPDA